MLRVLLALFRPLRSIATDIRIMRELYELELSERDRPIMRRTEKPSKYDTEVTYMGVEEEPKRKFKMWFNE